MKNRDYKNFAKGSIYHLYNRGNNKEIIFRDEQDYRAFMFRLGLALGFKKKSLDQSEVTKSLQSRIRINSIKANNFKLHAFCLMPNHYHLLIEQLEDVSISKLLHQICTSFSKYINAKHKRVGHVFQDAFKAVLIENNPQLMLISSYIHMNPVKDRITNKPEDYDWSSYKDFISKRNNYILDKSLLMGVFGSKESFITENKKLYDEVSKTPFDTFD